MNENYERARLADVSLMDQAVSVTMYGHIELAVPVGGSRRAGSMCVPDARTGRRVIRQLEQHPALFPNLRYVRAGRDYSANVEWGEPLPEIIVERAPIAELVEHERQVGRLYGYSEVAIQEYVEAFRAHFAW